jgi:hypothetical protein
VGWIITYVVVLQIQGFANFARMRNILAVLTLFPLGSNTFYHDNIIQFDKA